MRGILTLFGAGLIGGTVAMLTIAAWKIESVVWSAALLLVAVSVPIVAVGWAASRLYTAHADVVGARRVLPTPAPHTLHQTMTITTPDRVTLTPPAGRGLSAVTVPRLEADQVRGELEAATGYVWTLDAPTPAIPVRNGRDMSGRRMRL